MNSRVVSKSSSWSSSSPRRAYIGNPNDNWDLLVETRGANNALNLTDSAEIHEDQPDWSPDGSFIAYVAMTVSGDRRRSTQDLRIINVRSGNITELTNTADEYEALPRWSPDGKRIAFLSATEDGEVQLFTIEADGQNLTLICVVP